MSNWAIQMAEHWKQREDIVHAFGLILYTDSHPHLKKVLGDNDYWAALNEISGPKWPVFSIKPQQGTYGFPNLPPGHIGMMVQVWKEPRENKTLLSAFGLKSTEELPVLVVFCLGPEDSVWLHSISIKHDSVETAYSSLKGALDAATTAINDILPENSKNAEGIHAALDLTITSFKQWQLAKRGLDIFKKLIILKP